MNPKSAKQLNEQFDIEPFENFPEAETEETFVTESAIREQEARQRAFAFGLELEHGFFGD
ncbi:hypothetical protein [Desulfogranum marinum]|uniref:hypothetical protein n=1 Tax=Desulfogranum marinum TaxID=453220 RepID=UPI00196275FF|nr:hypothetical protein [Desulfogranum marinum]MBM9515211.1 hypothetical protein [Desulfogranum marinum]